MAADNGYKDTRSIIHNNEITTVRPGASLKYTELTGREKRDYLFEQGIRPTAYENYHDEKRPDLVTGLVRFGESAWQSIRSKSLGDTLTRASDELEEPKAKLFHTYGTTAKIVFAPEGDTPYTGIFSQRAFGLARFSYAGPIIGIGVVPGLALKFPIDNDHPSENLVVMRKLDRQQPLTHALSSHSHNSVFQNALTNILPLPSPTNVIMRVVKERFETVVETGKGLHQPVNNLATVCQNGERVESAHVNAPYRIIFRPTREAAASDPTLDFRDDLALHTKSGMAIYEVLALTESEEAELNQRGIDTLEDLIAHARKVGTLITESEFIASKYGDYRLFFQHNASFIRDEFRT